MEIIAHRGASHEAPENTLAAVRLAWSQDADAVEVDVHLTADGRLAVIHDSDTRRTTPADFKVAALTLEQLQRLDAGAWRGSEFEGECVPSLDAVLATVPPARRLFVELKSGPDAVPELARCLACSRLQPAQVAIIAFDLETVARAKRLLPRCEVAWILERASDVGRLARAEILARARAVDCDGLDLEAAWVDEDWRQQTRAAGFKCHVWTVDDGALARRLAGLGVDGITTNRPGWMRGQLSV